MSEPTIAFRDAMEELRAILDRIEDDDADLDALSHLVERAAELIRLCRGRINNTEMRVQRILDQLEQDLVEPAVASDDADSPGAA